MSAKIWDVLDRTDWQLLAEQKRALLIAVLDAEEHLDDTSRGLYEGLIEWLDHLQDAAQDAQYPVVWLDEEEQA